MIRISPLLLAILAMIAPLGLAMPAAAQSLRDFTLPPSEPAEEPEVQGPADDSGIVPVGPRVIPDADSTQQPVREPAQEERPAQSEEASPPASTTQRPLSRPAPSSAATSPTLRAPEPSPAIQAPPEDIALDSEPVIGLGTETQSDPIAFPPAAVDETSRPPTIEAPVDLQWLWYALGGLALILASLSGWLVWRRVRTRQVPQIERPIVAVDAQQSHEPARVDLDVEVTGLSRSLMTLMLNCRVSTINRSAHAVRDIGISADLTSAHRSLPIDQQLASAETMLPQCAILDRIGPNQSHHEQLSLQIPVAELIAFRHGEAALCVPLLRLRINAPAIEAQTRTFMVGIADGDAAARLQPIPLHVPPGSYLAARARLLV